MNSNNAVTSAPNKILTCVLIGLLPMTGSRHSITRSKKRIAPPLLPGRSSITVLGAGAMVMLGEIVSSKLETRDDSPRLRLERSFGLFLVTVGPMSSAI